MNSQYVVPIIPQNLNKNETIIQIAEVLDYLNNVTEDIFRVVNKRLDSNFQKLSSCTERIEVVNGKIHKLKGAKKATQVFSSCKYPAADINKEYVSIFSESKSPELPTHESVQRNYSSTYEPVDRLQFYHVNVPETKENNVSSEGLGEWPADLQNVNDLLLFNSGTNLYDNFVISDALLGVQILKEGETANTSNIGAAPASLTERASMTRSTAENYSYTPSFGNVPLLDVPLDLPDLPGVADDLRYCDAEPENNSIAPSAAVSKPPATVEPEITVPPIAELPVIVDNTPEVVVDIPDISVPLPPILPSVQEPPKAPEVKQVPAEAKKEEKPEPKVIVERINPIEDYVDVETVDDAVLDMRSSLMDAIRKAGGRRKLKPVQKRKQTKKAAAPSVDLMADLHAKLQMRRKGISGTKSDQQEAGPSFSMDSTFTKISAMIPPPPPKKDESSTSESEDWK